MPGRKIAKIRRIHEMGAIKKQQINHEGDELDPELAQAMTQELAGNFINLRASGEAFSLSELLGGLPCVPAQSNNAEAKKAESTPVKTPLMGFSCSMES